ncbi:MAG: Membrane-associated zinc metalloprotease [Parcubacteria group bacterium Gr01-1014_18]|nr:MAG: Membrane-associated zinc metalloprotease [Parcubacteria group bacterium Greene0416_36]TSC81523.1 MAG: Membrane-associated zinc metalloprotease [Parcubacteria group bacterium Gr01-1014_18]TSC99666.1 MAG: Membrane-associated zinc metalloprotease [Parcubacteria group bacterium Greene1014_20]TSD07117.1 MAG: Membrane-associated zinc metalloprotease [Parcubacteria group bacterium Greene0714_2]
MFTTLIIFLLVLGFLVFVHELGHFAAAKLFGVAVDEFAIGFPPRIVSRHHKGTDYSLNLIPLGGYVKIKGESGEFAEEEDSFSHKPIWQRMVIILAGVAMNFFAAFCLFSIGYSFGMPVATSETSSFSRFATVENPRIQVVEVLPDSPAQAAGVKMGDIIVSMDKQEITNILQMQDYLDQKKDASVSFNFQRGETQMEKNIVPVSRQETSRGGIGVALSGSAIVSYPFPVSLWEGAKRTAGVTLSILGALGSIAYDFFGGRDVEVALAGPVGIAVITGEVTEMGWMYLLGFTALLSINLAIINLLPFPALDGARALFLGIEKVRGRSLSRDWEGFIHTFGFGILMLLMVVVTYQDVIKYGGRIWTALISYFS